MKHWVIGTAGHVDHGKTTLVAALTGEDTDRLPEEKARGISIDIGFAEFALPSGRRAAIIDVPGHERFIRNMLAGITSIDLVVLVVAADEGVMPQTREHLDILNLLEIRKGLVVLTKQDLVDEELLALVREDVAEALTGTFLEHAPVLPVSATTGAGLPELKAMLDRLLDEVETKDMHGFARLPVDRAFTVAGFGTVVTGTLVAGTIRLGDRLELLPDGLDVRVRGLQVHGSKVEVAEAGQRVAVNLSGVERALVGRGNVLCAPGALGATVSLAGRLRLLPDWPKALPHGVRAHFHTGASETLVRILFLDRDELEPGETAYVMIKAEDPLVVGRGDHFVVRSYSPVHTMGGGIVIEPHGHYRRSTPGAIEELKAKESGGLTGVILETLARSGPAALSLNDLARRTGTQPEPLSVELAALSEQGKLLALESSLFLHVRGYEAFVAAVREYLAAYFGQYPLRRGAPKEELRRKALPGVDAKSFAGALALAVQRGEVAQDRDRLSLPGRVVTLAKNQEPIAASVAAQAQDARFTPPSLDELKAAVGRDVSEVVQYLEDEGQVVQLVGDLVLHRTHLEAAREIVRTYLQEHGRITVAEFRDLVGTTRKYALPILDYFDTERWTRRVGDERLPGIHL